MVSSPASEPSESEARFIGQYLCKDSVIWLGGAQYDNKRSLMLVAGYQPMVLENN